MGVNHHTWLREEHLAMFVISLWIYLDMTSKFIMWPFLGSLHYGICKLAPNGSFIFVIEDSSLLSCVADELQY